MMGDDSGEQQELSDVPAESKTYQERMLELYNDNRLSRIAIGFWLKLIVESAIVAVPIFLLVVIPGAVTHYLGFFPFSYVWIVGSAFTVTGSIVAATWCFTEEALSSIEREMES